MRRWYVRLLLGLAILPVLALGVFALLAKPAPDHPFFDCERPLAIAHRGGAGLWPENTLYAFERAYEMGVDVLEMDVRLSKDGVPVVIHDRTVERTTDGEGRVADFTLAELRALDAGYGWTGDGGRTFPFRGRGIRAPALAEALAAFPDARMNIEIKGEGEALADALCGLIRAHGREDRTLVVSGRHGTIEAFRRACPEVATAASFREGMTFYALDRLRLGWLYSPPNAFQGPEYMGKLRLITPRLIRTAHARNAEVHVWTANEAEDMRRLLDMGVDGIMTDYPDRLLDMLGRLE